MDKVYCDQSPVEMLENLTFEQRNIILNWQWAITLGKRDRLQQVIDKIAEMDWSNVVDFKNLGDDDRVQEIGRYLKENFPDCSFEIFIMDVDEHDDEYN